MKKLFIKTFIISLAFWQAVFSTAVPLIISAEEVPAETSSETEPTPSPEASPTPTPSPEPTTIETGDATSSATAENSANSAETEVPGSLTGEGCGPETTCPTDTQVSTEQGAETETSSSGTSETGENEATVSGDLAIDTGDAASQATSASQDNVDVVSLTNDEPQNPPNPTPVALEVETNQEATASAISSALSETGENMGLSEGELEIITGAAYAIATALNIANINLVGSDLVWLITTILGFEEGSINFYELFANMPSAPDGEIPVDATITTNQTSDLTSETQAATNTGANSAEGGEVEMETGEAISVANTVNLTNFNLVGTGGLFTVINIVGSLLGDIILPNGSHLLPSFFPWGNTEVVTNQEADVNSSSQADGNTGENELVGEGELSTGDATAVANAQSFANLVRIGDGWAFLILNLFGNWGGSLLNWDAPGSETTLAYGTHTLEQEWENPLSEGTGEGGSLTILTNQDATVNSSTSASSNTGINKLKGLGLVSTGNALAIANDFTLANFVAVGGAFMFGIFNVLGSWVGDLVVAYPDLEVSVTDGVDSITPGSSDEFTVTVSNRGDARANAVSLTLSFSGEFTPTGITAWDLGSLGPGETKTYKAQGTVSPTALANTSFGATATAVSSDTEESGDNNTASDTTNIVLPQPGPKDTRLPDLKVSVWNNVNDFVYPGDTVLASITVANQSPFPARDVRVAGSLSNDHPMPPIPMSWNLGDLRPGERVRIEFQIGLIEELPAGMYHLMAEATGKSEAGDEASSGKVISDFLLRLRQFAELLTPTVLASEENPDSGQILGVENGVLPIDKKRYLPYILGVTILVYLGILALRRKLDEEES
ncbi:MAG: CARDB domain-containing protein [Patescibacteria group bacterium]